MWVPPCVYCEVEKYTNQITNPSPHSSSTFHDSDLMEEIPNFLMKLIMKTNSFIQQDGITIHNFSLESNLDFCHPLSSTGHDSLYHDLCERSIPPTSFSHCLDFCVASSNWDQIQGNHITDVGEKEEEDSFNISSIFQNLPCEDDALPFLDDF